MVTTHKKPQLRHIALKKRKKERSMEYHQTKTTDRNTKVKNQWVAKTGLAQWLERRPVD